MNLRDYCKLEAERLVTFKYNDDRSLVLVKYTRKVFYENLWNQHPLLREARGHVFCTQTGDVFIWPFTKVFNRHENGTDLPLDSPVIAPHKLNGFMASARYWNGELHVTTTGSFDSDFVALARKHISQLDVEYFDPNYTYLFEICDPSDPHIVAEQEGAWLIGCRNMRLGTMQSEAFLDSEALNIGAKRSYTFRGTFGELLAQVESCQHEGFMVVNANTREVAMKIKSPHYLTKKFLMRMGKHKAREMFQNPIGFKLGLDEEFYGVFDRIMEEYNELAWTNLNERDRRAVIEDYLKEG